MHTSELARVATNIATAAVPPATIPVWGPSAVELFGVNIPLASMGLSLFGLAMARGVSRARDGASPGGRYLTGTLAAIMFGLVVEYRPGPGVAIAWGIGVGASGIVLYDMLRARVITIVSALVGKGKGNPAGGDGP